MLLLDEKVSHKVQSNGCCDSQDNVGPSNPPQIFASDFLRLWRKPLRAHSHPSHCTPMVIMTVIQVIENALISANRVTICPHPHSCRCHCAVCPPLATKSGDPSSLRTASE